MLWRTSDIPSIVKMCDELLEPLAQTKLYSRTCVSGTHSMLQIMIPSRNISTL
ncbi:MAG: hypothetical protein AVDCRST_MAG93-8967 [uncultured Chloroflexia bacterium]|uniref:Uncharacterized protein n=1 Tax=uncultured Chloroflexia bacterium TaxID=1672391 RepID=A0A6J4N5E4_9CHLR|nr:MAG: hypothetical protein AVDCRST_MAG93-8967 [uncultured Chloroflexia bacterium]